MNDSNECCLIEGSTVVSCRQQHNCCDSLNNDNSTMKTIVLSHRNVVSACFLIIIGSITIACCSLSSSSSSSPLSSFSSFALLFQSQQNENDYNDVAVARTPPRRQLRTVMNSIVDKIFNIDNVEESNVHESKAIEISNDDYTIAKINNSINLSDAGWSSLQQSDSNVPEVAWILSFGASGTSFTITNVEKMTNLSTASNYGRDYNPCVSLDSRGQGPYIRSLNKALPSKYILTKTHCGGYCIECDPSSYIHSVHTFEAECRTGQKRRPKGSIVTTTYSSDIPKRAIHLIRNPFDTLIGRMHLHMKHNVKRDDNSTVRFNGHLTPEETTYKDDANGLFSWCDYLDTRYRSADLKAYPKDYISKYMYTVPCHSEWFQFVQWHNLAYKVHEEVLMIPVHYMYYENYTSNFSGTVAEMFEFMEFPKESLLNEPLEWRTGKSYFSMFSTEHITAATKLVRELALPEVWTLIQHYFDKEHMS